MRRQLDKSVFSVFHFKDYVKTCPRVRRNYNVLIVVIFIEYIMNLLRAKVLKYIVN